MKVLGMKTGNNSTTHNGDVALPCLEGASKWEASNLKPNTHYACIMVAIPDGYRLVTEGQKRRFKRPSGMLYFNGDCWENSHAKSWYLGSVYIAPSETIWQLDLEEQIRREAAVAELEMTINKAKAQIEELRSFEGANDA